MPDLTLQERLQPSLLDRLTDDDPHRQQESRGDRVISMRQLRESVLRDLGWLMNTSNMLSVHDLASYPHVADSVLNYGVPDLSGRTVSSVDVMELQRAIRHAVVRFEPRLLPNTVQVQVVSSDEHMSHNALTFLIEGQLWAQPLPLQIFLKTEIDLELGHVKVVEQTAQETR
jgi:type VI secretion system protein ImpF